MTLLDYKDYYLIGLMSQSIQPLTVDDLAKLVGVSRRSVYYSLTKINDYLLVHKQPTLENHRDLGIMVETETKTFFRQDLHKKLKNTYIYSQKERIACIIVMLLTTPEPLLVIDFETVFTVSRNTIINDIKDLRQSILNFALDLNYDQQDGYQLTGNPLNLRSLLLYIVSSYSYLFKIHHFDMYHEEEYDVIMAALENVEETLSVQYVHATKNTLVKVLATIKRHAFKTLSFEPSDTLTIESSKEHKAVKEAFKDIFGPDEWRYVTLQLMGLRVHAHTDLDYHDDAFVKEVAQFVLDAFKVSFSFTEHDEKTLFNGLYMHFKSGLVRYKYGIIYDNKLKDEVEENYQALYHIAKMICMSLERKIGNLIPDDDVAYIAMHFGAYLQKEQREVKAMKVLLVCLNGVATSKILRKELEQLAEKIEIIDAVSIDQIDDYAKEVDYIISTVELKTSAHEHKIMYVNPLLTDAERKQLAKLFNTEPHMLNLDALAKTYLSRLKRIIKGKDYERAKQLLIEVFSQHRDYKSQFKDEDAMLKDLLIPEHIHFQKEVANYQEAIRLSAKVLIDKNIIEPRYVEKVIENVTTMGPYIVVAPNVVISHARPQDGVNALGMSALFLEKPVNFAEDKDRHARVIITLAAPDETQHLTALGQLSQMLMSAMDEFLKAEDVDTVYQLVQTYSS